MLLTASKLAADLFPRGHVHEVFGVLQPLSARDIIQHHDLGVVFDVVVVADLRASRLGRGPGFLGR